MTAKHASTILTYALGLWVLASGHAAAELGERNRYSCPDRLSNAQIDLKSSDVEWIALSRNFRLSAVSFLYAPELTSTLKWSQYDSKTDTATWHFLADEKEKWLGCNYGAVVLLKRLPDHISQCTTTSKKDEFGHLETVQVNCR
jgi:hypothetical protein